VVAARRALLAALPMTVRGTTHELGADWGGLALRLAQRYPEAPVAAWELSPLPWAVCALRARLAGPRHLSVGRADIMRADLGDAGLAACYRAPGIRARLRPRLEAMLQAGAV